jgi:hypothetical protein
LTPFPLPSLTSPPTPQAYDTHLNMILGDVEEVITTVEIDEETYEEIIKVRGERALIFRTLPLPTPFKPCPNF